MCTAISFQTKDHYFGRTLDLERTYCESVTVTPRHYPFCYRNAPQDSNHYAIIGMASVIDGYPLYYDATNEHGLSVAGLNFVGNTVYHPKKHDATNLTQFELIPWLLGKCKTVSEARWELQRINLLDEPFRPDLPLAKLHWLISDKSGSIVAESVAEGLRIYDNPVGVLTNNPPFPFQLEHLALYGSISAKDGPSRFTSALSLHPCSRGLSAIGLPGDFSSPSRFVRAAFVKWNSSAPETESASVSHFFHILASVAQPEGCIQTETGLFSRTQYTSCCNTHRGIYYYTTYNNHQISAVSLHEENLEGDSLRSYPMLTEEQIHHIPQSLQH